MSQWDVETNNNVTFDCKYHVVFCTKYRRKVLTPPMDERLKELFQLKSEELQVGILEMEIMRDYVTSSPQLEAFP